MVVYLLGERNTRRYSKAKVSKVKPQYRCGDWEIHKGPSEAILHGLNSTRGAYMPSTDGKDVH
jgi:hypothetical protein